MNPHDVHDRNAYLCSRHFVPENYTAAALRRRLLPNAVPTIVSTFINYYNNNFTPKKIIVTHNTFYSPLLQTS